MHSNLKEQSERILAALQAANGRLPMPELSRIGSGKPDGFCGSFTRRISDLREAGHNIVMTMEQIDGQRHTFYELVRQETQQELLQVN